MLHSALPRPSTHHHYLRIIRLQILAKQEESDRKAEALFGESSLLAAWSEVKATAYAELAERKQLVLALNKSVIEPLIQFRVRKLDNKAYLS